MGTDFQRTILWVFFGMSLFLLWDRWLVYTGKPSMFGTATAPQVTAPAPGTTAPPTPAATTSNAAIPATPAPATVAAPPAGPSTASPSGAKRPPVVIETDVVRATIDPDGAVLTRVELLKEKVAPDWTVSGLLGLVTGKKDDPDRPVVLLEVNPQRVYVAQSGVVGSDPALPNHRTPFTVVDGPRKLEDGKDALDVTLVAESGGVKLAKTYTFPRGRYDTTVKHELTNVGAAPVTPSLYMQIMRDGNKPEGESSLYYTYTGPVVFTEQDKFKKIEFSAIEKNKPEVPKATNNGWVGMIQHYFVTAWVPKEGEQREYYARPVEKNLYSIGMLQPLASLAPQASVTSTAQLYVGPQDQHALAKLAPGLDLVVDYGWLTFLRHPRSDEVMLDHADPAVLRSLRQLGLVLLDRREFDLLELVLVRVDHRSGVGVIQSRLALRLVAVAHDLLVQRGRNRRLAEVRHVVLDRDVVAATMKSVGLGQLDATRLRHQRHINGILALRKRARAVDDREWRAVIGQRRIRADDAGLCDIDTLRTDVEQDHRCVAVRRLAGDQPDQTARGPVGRDFLLQ